MWVSPQPPLRALGLSLLVLPILLPLPFLCTVNIPNTVAASSPHSLLFFPCSDLGLLPLFQLVPSSPRLSFHPARQSECSCGPCSPAKQPITDALPASLSCSFTAVLQPTPSAPSKAGALLKQAGPELSFCYGCTGQPKVCCTEVLAVWGHGWSERADQWAFS